MLFLRAISRGRKAIQVTATNQTEQPTMADQFEVTKFYISGKLQVTLETNSIHIVRKSATNNQPTHWG